MAAVVRELPLLAELRPLGVSVEVQAVGADGLVTLALSGPPKLRPAVEVQLRTALRAADARVQEVVYEG